MSSSSDRISGAFFCLFGLAMYFLVIPVYVETAEGGSLAPNTLPNIISIIIAVSGAFLVIKPTKHQMRDPRRMAITGFYVLLLIAGIYGMSKFGFEFVAPVLAFALMWMIGERRPLWLISGVVLMPALIWFVVTQLLGRGLP
ncbi:TctB domain containing protein [Sulfitobacter noctilucae]|uniref:tripartite tricarboxylate transporter TctB family protein n=1 Tax=Sulfitobacter noctilucae TaxID=1342302 RepID=UPI000AAEA16D|nr:tripartite tricarboxylate transporter TctB family protein [Sulfitobacter noctilucae]KIN61787.1 TctB domain containing protein [Sulfitobacter noctilucae]